MVREGLQRAEGGGHPHHVSLLARQCKQPRVWIQTPHCLRGTEPECQQTLTPLNFELTNPSPTHPPTSPDPNHSLCPTHGSY